jgi:OmpA-OmpF porin, OOP family
MAFSRLCLTLVILALLPVVGHAQEVAESRDFALERLQLAIGEDEIVGVDSGRVLPHLGWEAGFWLGYADDPLVAYSMSTGDRVGPLVANRLGGTLQGAVGLAGWAQLGLELDLIVSQSRGDGDAFTSMPLVSLTRTGLGDLRLAPKVSLWKRGVDVALFGTLRIPTSGADYYRGDDGVGASFGLALSRRFGAWRAGANVAYRVRNATEILNQRIDDELEGRIGAAVRVGIAELGVSLAGATAAKEPFGTFNQNALELLAEASLEVVPSVTVFAGGGLGLAQGFGTPDWRFFVGSRIGQSPPPRRLQVVEPAPIAAAPAPPPPEPKPEPAPLPPPPEPPHADPVAPPPPPQKIELVGDVFFRTNRAEIRHASYPVLDKAAAVIVAHPEIARIEVQGHTDDVGDDAANLDLSQRRAQSVVEYLVKKGVARDRLTAKGYGETEPLSPETTRAARAKNRRVELVFESADVQHAPSTPSSHD